MGKGCEEVPR
jgi:Ca2+/Na+ antiporter